MQRRVNAAWSNSTLRRTISCVHSAGISSWRSVSASSLALRPVMKKVGERCSMVTCAHWPAIAGISVAAVAPEPMTTTRLPARSRSSGQVCGCTMRPPNESMPGHCGV
jgi:hypothetical protein